MLSSFCDWVWTQADLDEALAMQREVEADPHQLEWQGSVANPVLMCAFSLKCLFQEVTGAVFGTQRQPKSQTSPR